VLTTFAKTKKETVAEDATVSYHETAGEIDVIECSNAVPDDPEFIPSELEDSNDPIDNTTDANANGEVIPSNNHISFSKHVMVSVIAEDTVDDDDRTQGNPFGLLFRSESHL
jgi:hypothetical protein